MLHLFAVIPAAGAARALADGTSGTLGAGVVGPYELRPGAVGLDRMAPLPGGVVLGRAEGPAGAPEALSAAQLQALTASAAAHGTAADLGAFAASVPGAATISVETLGHSEPGDGGGARYLRRALEPAHPGKVRTADGTWWELAAREVSPRMFGALADGDADDTAAFADAVAYAGARGAPVVGAEGEVYRLTATIPVTVSGTRLTGRGAAIDFRTDLADAFAVGDGDARIENVTVEGWRATFAFHRCALVFARRASGLRVIGNRVEGGHLVYTWLADTAAGITGATFDPNKPNIAALTEDDLNRDLTVRDNHVRGGASLTGPTKPIMAAAIRASWVDGFVAEGNTLFDLNAGIIWWGGDSNPARDGGVGSVRWARNVRIAGNHVRNTRSSGIWGSQGENVVVAGNNTEYCGDIGVHGEGDLNAVYDANTCRNCKNGGMTPFFECENTVYSNNTVIVDDAAFAQNGGFVTMAKWNIATPAHGAEVRFTGNVLQITDLSLGLGQVVLQNGGQAVFDGNTLLNVRLRNDSAGGNGGRQVCGNVFRFTHAPSEAFHAVHLRGIAGAAGGAGIATVEGNLFDASAIAVPAGSSAVRIGATGASRHRVSRNFELGFPLLLLTESLGAGGTHAYFVHDNAVSGIVHVDVTHGESLGETACSVSHRGSHRSAGGASSSPYASGSMPAHGIWTNGSLGLWSGIAAGGSAGFAAVGGGGAPRRAASGGAWTSGRSYALWDHVTGSDGSVHVCIAPHVSGGSTNPVGGASRAAHWRKAASAAAEFRALGAMPA